MTIFKKIEKPSLALLKSHGQSERANPNGAELWIFCILAFFGVVLSQQASPARAAENLFQSGIRIIEGPRSSFVEHFQIWLITTQCCYWDGSRFSMGMRALSIPHSRAVLRGPSLVRIPGISVGSKKPSMYFFGLWKFVEKLLQEQAHVIFCMRALRLLK